MSQAVLEPQHPEQEEQLDDAAATTGELPAWLDKGFPWIASILLHLGLLLLIVFAAAALSSVIKQTAHPIIVPQTWDQHYSAHPGGNPNSGQNHNPLRQARQNLKHVLSHYANTSQTSVAALLNSSATKSLQFIAVGPQGGASGGPLASFGVPGGSMGSGPPSRFLGNGGNATRIVYIIDHSGWMLYNFQFVGHQLQKSVDGLVPIQRFGVILVANHAATSLISGGLQHATQPAKDAFWSKFTSVAPSGKGQGLLTSYVSAFQKALQMHPQIIYFVSNGGFDPALAEKVKQMDPQGGARVFTYTFLNGNDPSFLQQLNLYAPALKTIAQETGGQYRLIKNY